MPVVKDLGVLLDTHLSYNQHITEIASKCLFKLYQINRIKHLLDRKTLLLVINSFVFSKLQYCSTVWSNTSSSNIDKLQKVQNFAGRIILGLRKYDHISDGLRSLKWLPIREKLILNDATMMHKCINKLVPDYLADMFVCVCVCVIFFFLFTFVQSGKRLPLFQEIKFSKTQSKKILISLTSRYFMSLKYEKIISVH